jgi:hypothetical protein
MPCHRRLESRGRFESAATNAAKSTNTVQRKSCASSKACLTPFHRTRYFGSHDHRPVSGQLPFGLSPVLEQTGQQSSQ